MGIKPSSLQRVASCDASVSRTPAASTRKTPIGNLLSAIWKPWTV
jgi:hypothetical protein